MTFFLIVVAISIGLIVLVLLTAIMQGDGLNYRIYQRHGQMMYREEDVAKWVAVLERLPLAGISQVLDVGTATGMLPLALVNQPDFDGRVLGVDYAPALLQVAAKLAHEKQVEQRVAYLQADMRQGLPLANAAFELIFCVGVLEMLPDFHCGLQELCRVMADDGLLVMSFYRRVLGMKAARVENWYRGQLAAAGFEAGEVIEFRPRHDLLVAHYRINGSRTKIQEENL
jgi:ubiquinone/menaquinone biosynthesis C-methylase UbiE